ncbi:MAG: SLBB domain-containing protein, partial [Armatimonadetes bacterium]|nr:SLBB domain-containing protein [Armatimonadota bacterium]
TPEQLSLQLTGLYARFVREPKVTVIALSFKEPKITVSIIGEVVAPGPVDLPPGSRVLDAIARVRGLTAFAVTQEAVLVRGEQRIPIDLNQALRGDPQHNAVLRDGDALVIGTTRMRVSVVGEARTPSSVELPPTARVLDAIAAAGGLTPTASTSEARLVRGAQVIAIDLERVMRGDPAHNLLLRPGDALILLQEVERFAMVVGEVNRPGSFRLDRPMTVLDLLVLAGGITEKASLAEARLVRKGANAAMLLRLEPLLFQGDTAANVALQPGDVIVIPQELSYRVYVLGGVQRPGMFTHAGRISVLQALTVAGGPTRGAQLARSVIVRRAALQAAAGTPGQAQPPAQGQPAAQGQPVVPPGVDPKNIVPVDLGALLLSRDPRQDVPMFNGDVLFVPENRLFNLLEIIIQVVTGVRRIITP